MEKDFDQPENEDRMSNDSRMHSKHDAKYNAAQTHQHLQPLLENRSFVVTPRNIDLYHSDSYVEKRERNHMFAILMIILVILLAAAILVYMRILTTHISSVEATTQPQFVKLTGRTVANVTIIHTPATISIVHGHRYVQYFRDYLYHLHTREETWANAVQKCTVWQGHLVSINDTAEQQFVQSLQRELRIWIGYSVVNESGFTFYRWTDKSETFFEDWESQTDDSNLIGSLNEVNTTAACVAQSPMVQSGNGTTIGSWQVKECNTKLAFLCKKLSPYRI